MSGEFHFTHFTQPPPKSELSAHALNLLFPGIGLSYWRRDSWGAAWSWGFLTIVTGLLAAWILRPYLPQLLATLIIILWVSAEWYLFELVRSTTPDEPEWTRRGNKTWTFLGLGSLCSLLLSLIIYVTFTRVYTFVEVSDNSMFPQLLTGDTLLVSRRIQGGGSFESGELVAYQSASGAQRIARVITSSDQTKKVEIDRISIRLDGRPLSIKPVEIDVTHFADKARQSLRSSLFFIERSGKIEPERSWLISHPLNIVRPHYTFTGNLGNNTLLVASDVRHPSAQKDAQPAEVIDQSRVIGIPLMIVKSTYQHDEVATRRGLRLY